MPFGATKELIMNILDNQIAAQLENRTDIEVQCKDTTAFFKIKLYMQKKGRTELYWIQYFGSTHHLSKAEYEQIIEDSESDIFGNLTLTCEIQQEFKDKYYEKRPNVILEKVGKALFGNSWKKITAEYLDVDERRITHWIQCTRSIPKNIFIELRVIKNKRLKEIADIEKYLDI